jgi:hypothetical protein
MTGRVFTTAGLEADGDAGLELLPATEAEGGTGHLRPRGGAFSFFSFRVSRRWVLLFLPLLFPFQPRCVLDTWIAMLFS